MKRFLAVLFVLLIPAALLAVETATITHVLNGTLPTSEEGFKDSFRCLKLYWKADASGDKADVTLPAIRGRIVAVVTDPGATAPADNYDMTLLNSEGIDVMFGGLANRHTTTTQVAQPLAGSLAIPGGMPTYGALTLTFTAQANANCDGEVFIYYVE